MSALATSTSVPERSIGAESKLDVSLDVFEGPEKKLEVFFSCPSSPAGFRQFDHTIWSPILAEAHCSILHCQPGAHFDSYLLSESSLFVYPSRVILKTCGTTTLILVLPKLLALAERLGARLEHVHYSHLRYKFPTLQVHPHTSFRTERRCLAEMLEGRIAAVRSRVIGAQSGTSWYALCTEALPPLEPSLEPPLKKKRELLDTAGASPTAPYPYDDLDNIFELSMERLPKRVCDLFFEAAPVHQGRRGRALARSMTEASGIGALLPAAAVIDDWAFEPCGYSMNASHEQHYYTIHITPEFAFSYASFETNDPSYRKPEHVAAIVRVFSPALLTVTLTTRTGLGLEAPCELPGYQLDSLPCTSREHHTLTSSVSVCCITFEKDAGAERSAVKGGESTVKATHSAEEGSEASSDDTFEIGEVAEL